MLIVFIFLTYLASTLIGYLVHKLFHQKWAGFASKSHIVHHLEKYPPNDLVSDKYRNAGTNTTVLLFVPIVIIALAFMWSLSYFKILSPLYAIVGIIEILFISIAHNILHDAFHIKKSIFHKIPRFNRLQKLHFIHHHDMNSNFGIFDFTWDMIFNTFSSEQNCWSPTSIPPKPQENNIWSPSPPKDWASFEIIEDNDEEITLKNIPVFVPKMKLPFQTTYEQTLNLASIIVLMENSGIDRFFIAKSNQIAKVDQSVYDLMLLWKDSTDQVERYEILFEIRKSIKDYYFTS